MPRNRVYRRGVLATSDCHTSEISDYLADPDTVVWVDLSSPDPVEIRRLADEVGLDPLAVEDALTERQRTKLDRYQDHFYLSVYSTHYVPADGSRAAALHSSELAIFASSRYLITVRKDGLFQMDNVVSRWDDNGDLAGAGVSFLLWGLLDYLVDGYFTTVEELDDEVDAIQDMLFDQRMPSREIQLRTFALRRTLALLRKVFVPMREVLNALTRPDLGIMADRMAPYYRDVYDHVIRATEQTETQRDLIGSILETTLAIQGNRLNEIMKRLTGWAAVIAVPTAITGFYGMNVKYPQDGTVQGFVSAILLIVLTTVGLYLWMKRRDWI